MILSVNIVRDRASNRHESCSRSYRKKPAPRNNHFEQVAERYTSFNADAPSFPVVIEDAIERAAIQQVAAAIETGISIAASHSIGQKRFRFCTPQSFG